MEQEDSATQTLEQLDPPAEQDAEETQTEEPVQAPHLPITETVFGKGYPVQAAQLEFSPPEAVYHTRREPGLPHLFHATDQQSDLLVGLNSYQADLVKKRQAESRAKCNIGSLLPRD